MNPLSKFVGSGGTGGRARGRAGADPEGRAGADPGGVFGPGLTPVALRHERLRLSASH